MAQASEIKKQYKKRTLFQETWRRLTKNRGAMLGLAFLVLLVLAAALSPVIFNYEKDVIGQNMKDRLMGPCAAHWFGTDEYGRDLFARIVYGARYSLIIGVGSVLLGLLVGTILGSQAGFKGGITDSIIMRGIDIFYSIPPLSPWWRWPIIWGPLTRCWKRRWPSPAPAVLRVSCALPL